ncbi:MAG TPA: FRG domain-containing protein [Pyrinomonadaceae bacterium]
MSDNKSMTWNDIVDQAKALHDRYRADGSLAWYRGHRDAAWELKSTMHRHVDRMTRTFPRPTPHEDSVSLLREEYKTLYRRFKADAWSLLGERERSEWGVLFTMQHFSIPTRLMDWTESFACAVFFAQLRRKREDTAAIWVVDPQALNLMTVGRDGLMFLGDDTSSTTPVDPHAWHPRWTPPEDPLPTVAAAPLFTNPRMVAQRSMFTLAGDSFQPLEEQYGQLVREERLSKIVLPPQLFDDADEYLSIAGLTAFNFYPDLQGLALKHEARAEQTIRDAKIFYPQFFENAP